MPILKYVPPKKEIIDHRSPEGGYYVAKCEVCETEFYPARSNAKYCCYNCGLIAHRTAVANGTAKKRKPKKDSTSKEKEYVDILTGRDNVIDNLRNGYPDSMKGRVGELRRAMYDAQVGEKVASSEEWVLTKISPNKYRVASQS